jgi:hypothetical protein
LSFSLTRHRPEQSQLGNHPRLDPRSPQPCVHLHATGTDQTQSHPRAVPQLSAHWSRSLSAVRCLHVCGDQLILDPVPIKTTPETLRASVHESFSRLTAKPDLLLIHHPYVPEDGKIGQFWKILEDLVEDGTLAGVSLGVCNFRPQDLEAILKVAKIKPVVNRESSRGGRS